MLGETVDRVASKAVMRSGGWSQVFLNTDRRGGCTPAILDTVRPSLLLVTQVTSDGNTE